MARKLEAVDPVTYVPGITCPDAHGVPRPLVAGYECCADHGLGAGACPEGTSCMAPDLCSGPLPPNDPRLGWLAPGVLWSERDGR